MKTNLVGKSGGYKPRYSNADGWWGNGGSEVVSTGITTTGSVLSSIFGSGDKYRANALEIINDQQRKTTAILWVVIGLMAALGVVLLIRKTK